MTNKKYVNGPPDGPTVIFGNINSNNPPGAKRPKHADTDAVDKYSNIEDVYNDINGQDPYEELNNPDIYGHEDEVERQDRQENGRSKLSSLIANNARRWAEEEQRYTDYIANKVREKNPDDDEATIVNKTDDIIRYDAMAETARTLTAQFRQNSLSSVESVKNNGDSIEVMLGQEYSTGMKTTITITPDDENPHRVNFTLNGLAPGEKGKLEKQPIYSVSGVHPEIVEDMCDELSRTVKESDPGLTFMQKCKEGIDFFGRNHYRIRRSRSRLRYGKRLAKRGLDKANMTNGIIGATIDPLTNKLFRLLPRRR